MDQIIRIGMDTSKHVFQLHGVNAAEEPVLRKKLRRQDLITFFGKLPPTVVALEACGGSHRHRQLNRLRQVRPSWTVNSEASGDASYLGPDPEGSGAGLAVISSVGVGGTTEEVCHLIVNREKALGLSS